MNPIPFEEGQLKRTSFAKQKRNLLVISVLLTAGLWIGISFTSLAVIKIFGQELLIAKPERIAHVAWMMWLYFLIRYIAFQLQYQQPEEKFVNVFRHLLNNEYTKILNRELLKTGISYPEYDVERIQTTFLLGNFYLRLKPSTSNSWGVPTKLSITPTKTSFTLTRVLAKALFGTASTSEYYLPYLIAFLPVALLLIR